MRRTGASILGTVILLGTILCMGGASNPRVPLNLEGIPVSPGQVHTYIPAEWTRFGGSAAVFSTAATSPGPTARSLANFQANSACVIQERDSRWNHVQFRASSATENEVNVYDVFTMIGTSDFFTRIGTLTFTTGKATSGITDNEFADSVVVTNSDGFASWYVASPGSDGTAYAIIDIGAASNIAIVPTTVGASASGVVEVTGF